ncbi:ATP-binding protein [Planomonospora sp. ID82291]|uniref:ATP-binding protein n=1 Tax=Planomonospora sp. ID82291 TaxID=2738136 RepID=UPI0018C3C55A|nr:ATP-binding protein [Planomonospora sp. ID82291]MBG0815674.1 GAF domain-containing protein [Planomonospora sp. ID82291]
MPGAVLLDRLTRLTARLLRAPAALVALADHDRQVVVSAAGPAGRRAGLRSPLPAALRERVEAADGPLVVTDTGADERLRRDRTIGGLEAVACAAFPLHGPDGETLGALCAIDVEPRRWDRAQLELGGDLARTVEEGIALRRPGGERPGGERPEEERTFLQALLDSLDTGVAACDRDGRVVLVNRVLRESRPPLLGVHVGDLAGIYGIFAADGRTPLPPEEVPLARAFAGELVDGQEVVVRTDDRHPCRIIVNGRPIEAADGRRLGAVVAVRDVTDQHRAQALHRAQHAVAGALIDASSREEAATGVVAAVTDALGWVCGEYWQVDPGETGLTRIGLWTRPECDLSAFVGEPRMALRPVRGMLGRVWESGRELWICDLPHDPRDFTRREQALRAGLRAAIALPVRSGRQVLGVLVFYSDTVQERDDGLTALLDGVCAHVGRYMERRRAEELTLALAASRRRFEQIVTHVNDDVWTAEITPDGRARPLYVSTSGAGILGERVPPEERSGGGDMIAIVGRYVHPDDRPVFVAFCERLVSGHPAEAEFRLAGLDGATHWAWIRALPRREGGRLFVDGISTDVTERHRMAEERERLLAEEQRQVRRLRELDRMKDELVALVSHELRSPIGTIRGYVEMLLDDPELGGEHRAFADVIDRKSADLQRLVDDLLDLARLDAGRIAIDPRPVSLTRLLNQSVEDHRPEAAAKRLTVQVDLGRHLRVHADPARLRQVVDNLLSNAVKYTPAGGAVDVAARRDGDEVAVTVADTGIGVPAEQYPQLFGRFFRATTAKEAGIKGTGLGLAIIRAIVEAHGGTVTAAPREDGGTVFTVRLPAEPPQED